MCKDTATNIFEQTQNQNWQHLHIFGDGDLSTGARARGSHISFVRRQNLCHLRHKCFSRIFELRRNRPFDSFVRQKGG